MLGLISRWTLHRAQIGLVAISFIAVTVLPNSAIAQPKKVIELFTSQGCSSCPPADKLAEKLVMQEKDVLTLLLPIDYWDYLGWKDTLANPKYSQRQRAYAKRRGDRSVYTPQMVISGGEHVVGSREADVRAALARAEPFTTQINLSISDMVVEANVEGALPTGATMATIYFVSLMEEAIVDIGRGENEGRKIRYVNVVKDLQPMGMWSGGDETFRMPKSKLMSKGNSLCAVLVQIESKDGPGQIIGAAVRDWRGAS